MNKLKFFCKLNQSYLHFDEEELRYPHQVFDDFFNAFHLQQARAELWQWLIVALGSECGEYDDAKSRSNLIAFYEILESLVEAAWIIDQNRKAKNNI